MEQLIADRIDADVRSLGETVAIQGHNDPAHDEVKAGFHEVAHIDGEPGYRLGAEKVFDLDDTGGTEPVFVCFYTHDTPYQALAARLPPRSAASGWTTASSASIRSARGSATAR